VKAAIGFDRSSHGGAVRQIQRVQIVPLPPRVVAVRAPPIDERHHRANEASSAESRSGSQDTFAEVDDGGSPAALHAALRLARNPGLKRKFQHEPLPDGIRWLIRVASQPPAAAHPGTKLNGADPVFLRAASIFFLESVLWMEGGNPFRALGLPPGASQNDIAVAAWTLMLWLHPFIGSAEPEGVFADRVMDAWIALKAGAGRYRVFEAASAHRRWT